MKRIIELSIKGVGIALVLFTLFGLIVDGVNGGVYEFRDFTYTKMVIGAVVSGLGFSVPGIVYEETDLPYIVKILIHMGIGCTIFIITGYIVGWFSVRNGMRQCVFLILTGLIVSFLILVGFILRDKKMAKKMNERINEMKNKD